MNYLIEHDGVDDMTDFSRPSNNNQFITEPNPLPPQPPAIQTEEVKNAWRPISPRSRFILKKFKAIEENENVLESYACAANVNILL